MCWPRHRIIIETVKSAQEEQKYYPEHGYAYPSVGGVGEVAYSPSVSYLFYRAKVCVNIFFEYVHVHTYACAYACMCGTSVLILLFLLASKYNKSCVVLNIPVLLPTLFLVMLSSFRFPQSFVYCYCIFTRSSTCVLWEFECYLFSIQKCFRMCICELKGKKRMYVY